MEIKTTELAGSALDWATAKALGLEVEVGLECCGFGVQTSSGSPPECCGDPLTVVFSKPGRRYQPSLGHKAPDACRIIVASRLGDIVDIPQELQP